MTRLALRNHSSSDDVERREQCNSPVAEVIMRHPLGIAQPHRQQRLGALQRLDLTLLVNAQDQRLVRRIEVKPNDVTNLLDEERVSGELKALGAVRLDSEQSEIAPHRAFRDAGFGRRAAHCPVGDNLGLALQHGAQQSRYFIVAISARSPRAELPMQPGRSEEHTSELQY